MGEIQELKLILREETSPFFTDEEIAYYLNKNNGNINSAAYAYGTKTDEKAYAVKATWNYTDDEYSDYQKEATLVFIHDGKKLSLVELQ